MNKGILWSIIAVLAITVVWLASRQNLPAAAEPMQTAGGAPTASPSPEVTASALSPAAGSQGKAEAASTVPPPIPESAQHTAEADPIPATNAGLPIDVSPGFEYLDKAVPETDGLWPVQRRHQQLQGEPRDNAWAPMMEAALRQGIQDALIAKGYDPERIELPVVECRTNGCEIQALSYPEDFRKHVADLQFIVPALLRGNLGNELEKFSAAHNSRADGRLTILVQLSRKRT